MKKSTKAVMLGAVATAHAQSYTTSTFIECTPTAAGGTITSYATMTSTVCDLCEHMSTTMVGGMPVHVTAYTTVYTNACPTGLVPVTYTITESCTGMTPTFTGPDNTNAGYMPPGFTTTTLDCGCDKETPGPRESVHVVRHPQLLTVSHRGYDIPNYTRSICPSTGYSCPCGSC